MSKYKIVLVGLVSFFLSACSNNSQEDTWLVATSADNPPYEHMHQGNIEGFDIDLMNEIAKHLGKKVEFKNMEFHGLIAALSSKNVDMVIAAMSYTKERAEKVDFSIPYTKTQISVIYRKEDGITDGKGLKNGIVGAQLGTIWSSIAHDLSLEYGFQTQILGNNLMLIEELKNNRLNAVIMEESQINKFKELYPEFDSFCLQEYVTSFSIAFPQGSPLKKDIDATIKLLQDNGTIETLSQKWGVIRAQ